MAYFALGACLGLAFGIVVVAVFVSYIYAIDLIRSSTWRRDH